MLGHRGRLAPAYSRHGNALLIIICVSLGPHFSADLLSSGCPKSNSMYNSIELTMSLFLHRSDVD